MTKHQSCKNRKREISLRYFRIAQYSAVRNFLTQRTRQEGHLQGRRLSLEEGPRSKIEESTEMKTAFDTFRSVTAPAPTLAPRALCRGRLPMMGSRQMSTMITHFPLKPTPEGCCLGKPKEVDRRQ